MKGIYLTEEGKEEIEVEIKNLEDRAYESGVNTEHYFNCFSKIELLQEILYFATVLPAEESWYNVIENVENDSQSLILHTPFIMKSLYEHGVIIKSKI